MTNNSFVRSVVVGLVLLLGIILWTSCAQQTTSESPSGAKPELMQKPDPVERGKYLVTIGGCQDCHSPHDKDGGLVAGKEFTGHWKGSPEPEWTPALLKKNILMAVGPDFTSFGGPWGISKARNLTPDNETGIGTLSEEQFVDLFRRGTLMPPMPIQWMSQMTDDDLKAIYAYLRTLPAVNNGAVSEPTKAKPAEKS